MDTRSRLVTRPAPHDGGRTGPDRFAGWHDEPVHLDEIADQALERIVAGARAGRTPVDEPLEAVRTAARERARKRPPGPAMPTQNASIAGVPVRCYQPGAGLSIVYAHGGAFVFGDLDSHDAQVRRLAAATGASVIAVDYRRAPEHPFPAAVDDVAAVLTDVTRPVAVAGDSAGGLIAVLAALRLRGRRGVVAQLLVCPNIDPTLSSPSVREKGQGWLLDADDLRRRIAQWMPDPATRRRCDANPLVADLSGAPPALVVTAEHDPLRDEADAYAARLTAAGVPVVHRREPGLVHNFPTLRHLSPACAAAEDRFLADAAALLSSMQ